MNKHFVFHIREYNDCDHLTPVMWKLLSEDHKVICVPYYGFDALSDFRIKFLLKNFQNFKVINLPRIYKSKSAFFFKVFEKSGIRNKFVVLIFKILNLPFKYMEKSIFKGNPVMIWDWGNPGRLNHFESIIYKIATVVLPHGIDIFTNRYDGRSTDLSDRSIYDYYLLNDEFQKQISIKKHQMSPSNLIVKGVPRFSSEWIKVLHTFIPEFKFGDISNKKVVYFLPHADFSPNIELIEKLIEALSLVKDVSVVVKMSTRQKNIFRPKGSKTEGSYKNINFDEDTPSTSLIQWSDIVINHGSSIVFDALQMKKDVIHASFLDNLNTIFDKSECVHLPKSINELLEIIQHPNIQKKDVEAFVNKRIYLNSYVD